MRELEMVHGAPVSVIIPCYLCKNTIERAVDSVWKQTWKPSEVILVEDASSDGGETLKALNGIKDKFASGWIRVIPLNENKGPGNARNVGWDQASQEYIAFLDSDDAWHPQKIEFQLKLMRDNPDLVLAGHLCEVTKNELLDKLKYYDKDIKDFMVYTINRRALLISNRFSTPSAMLKRDVRFRFDPCKRFSEDYLLWLEIVLGGGKVCVLDLPLAFLYKAAFGEGGLSGKLFCMEKGELDTYRKLFDKGLIKGYEYLFYSFISLVKFIRRILISFKRNKRCMA